LLAYAQKRIRLLEDTLKERERQEGKLLEEALKKQQNEQEKLSAMKLKHELEKLKTELDGVMMQKVYLLSFALSTCQKFTFPKMA
jgi:N12 class adenine-specific DNA methylase